ncbi:hypothetical protein P0Y35_03665 [Kiritimatiellaeota bacterium B1221]|nr:hypothetical protein [Kiritimatiellaeota bacterium B1221]
MSIPLKKIISTLSVLSAGSYLFTPAMAQPAPETEAAESSRWSFSAGALSRQFDGGEFRSGSRSGSVSLPSGSKEYTLSAGEAGAETGEVLRTYSDGFVGPDTAGTTSGSFFEGTTSRYGFENDSQAGGGTTLVFQGPLSGVETLSSGQSSQSGLAWSDDADAETGAILELTYRLTAPEKTVSILGQFSFLYSPLEISGGGSTFEAERKDTRNALSGTLTDTYQVPSGVILPLAPYSQSSENPPPGFYPRIMDEPTRSLAPESSTVSSTNISWFNEIDENVDADVFTFSFGPEIMIHVTEGAFLSLSAGAAMHLVDWKATHEETLYQSKNGGEKQAVTTWRDEAHKTDIVWGGFGQVAGGLTFGPDQEPARYFLQGFARWDVAEDLKGEVGPSEFTLNLDAFSAGAMAGFFF